jgi:hypothetical protein
MGIHNSRKLQLEQATLMDSLFISSFSVTLVVFPSNHFIFLRLSIRVTQHVDGLCCLIHIKAVSAFRAQSHGIVQGISRIAS